MQISNKKSFFFYELHILNLPLALFLSLFGKVIIFKYRGFCSYFLKKPLFESISDFVSVDQWVQKKEDIHKTIKKYSINLCENLQPLYFGKTSIDISRLFTQQFCIDYESYILFVTLVNNYSGSRYIVNYLFRSFLTKAHPHLIDSTEFTLGKVNWGRGDLVYSFFSSLYELLKIYYRIFLGRSKKNFSFKKYKYVCTGISAVEYPEKINEIDFSWLVINDVLNANEILYILDLPPNAASVSYLQSNQIEFITRDEALSALPFAKKLSVLFRTLLSMLRFRFLNPYASTFTINSYNQSLYWNDILKLYSPSYFIYSFSRGWPETPSTLSCKYLNIKSILWFYSSGEFLYSTKKKNFSDLSVRFCIFQADEVWVWNQEVKDLFVSRLLYQDDSKKIHVVGPILNGSWEPFKPAHKSLTIPFTISIFDLSPMKEKMRLNYGEGPFCNKVLQEVFFQGILKAYNYFPNVHFIIKTKRNYDKDMYDEVPTLNLLLNSNLERVEFLDPKISPYYAVAKSNLIISTPFTSPTILALSLNKTAIYFDPIHLCNYSFKNVFDDITLKSEDALIRFIQSSIDEGHPTLKNNHSTFRPITLDDVNKRLKERLI